MCSNYGFVTERVYLCDNLSVKYDFVNFILFIFRVQAELNQETQKTVELIDTIEKQSQHLYYAEPPVDMPYIPPNTGLSQKNGYLFLKTYVYY